jgi:hypothetical protein
MISSPRSWDGLAARKCLAHASKGATAHHGPLPAPDGAFTDTLVIIRRNAQTDTPRFFLSFDHHLRKSPRRAPMAHRPPQVFGIVSLERGGGGFDFCSRHTCCNFSMLLAASIIFPIPAIGRSAL